MDELGLIGADDKQKRGNLVKGVTKKAKRFGTSDAFQTGLVTVVPEARALPPSVRKAMTRRVINKYRRLPFFICYLC